MHMSEESNLPEYLTEGDGYIDIALRSPITVDGAKVQRLRMREPEVRDQEAAQRESGDNSLFELKYFANLMEIPMESLRGMKMRDYKRVQVAYERFTD
jgi:hypothetical protein